MKPNTAKNMEPGGSPPPRRGTLRAVPPSKTNKPAIKVYTGSEELKKRIESAAKIENPNQSASAFLIGLFWKHQKSHSAE